MRIVLYAYKSLPSLMHTCHDFLSHFETHFDTVCLTSVQMSLDKVCIFIG